MNADAAVITTLLGQHADPNLALPGGETPPMTAARSRSVASLKALLAHAASVENAARDST